VPKNNSHQPINTVTPLIKWAGGKRALLHEIHGLAPKKYTNYFEPFLGGGAVFFSVSRDIPRFASDFNSELISMYEVVRDFPHELIESLQGLDSDKESFYEIRSRDRDPNFLQTVPPVSRAARFIYLNKTCFNGMHRLNSRGQFNVPYAGRTTDSYRNKELILNASALLNEISRDSGERLVTLESGSFDEFLTRAKPGEGSWVYLDPPYAPISETSSFVSYERNAFGEKEHRAVFEAMTDIDSEGGKVLLSNSDADLVKSLIEEYRPRFRQLNVKEIDVRRSISAKASSRVIVKELLIYNYTAGD
jgi:DNA adenine methylase